MQIVFVERFTMQMTTLESATAYCSVRNMNSHVLFTDQFCCGLDKENCVQPPSDSNAYQSECKDHSEPCTLLITCCRKSGDIDIVKVRR